MRRKRTEEASDQVGSWTDRFHDSDYHRRRAEAEMDRALHAQLPDVALVHLELARIHREKRDELAMAWRQMDLGVRPPIGRTDKES